MQFFKQIIRKNLRYIREGPQGKKPHFFNELINRYMKYWEMLLIKLFPCQIYLLNYKKALTVQKLRFINISVGLTM